VPPPTSRRKACRCPSLCIRSRRSVRLASADAPQGLSAPSEAICPESSRLLFNRLVCRLGFLRLWPKLFLCLLQCRGAVVRVRRAVHHEEPNAVHFPFLDPLEVQHAPDFVNADFLDRGHLST